MAHLALPARSQFMSEGSGIHVADVMLDAYVTMPKLQLGGVPCQLRHCFHKGGEDGAHAHGEGVFMLLPRELQLLPIKAAEQPLLPEGCHLVDLCKEGVQAWSVGQDAQGQIRIALLVIPAMYVSKQHHPEFSYARRRHHVHAAAPEDPCINHSVISHMYHFFRQTCPLQSPCVFEGLLYAKHLRAPGLSSGDCGGEVSSQIPCGFTDGCMREPERSLDAFM
eukprot:6476495-Amphidinium_carterae.2